MYMCKECAKMNGVNRFYVNFIHWDSEYQKHFDSNWDGMLIGEEEQVAQKLNTDLEFLKKIHIPEKYYFKQFRLLPVD